MINELVLTVAAICFNGGCDNERLDPVFCDPVFCFSFSAFANESIFKQIVNPTIPVIVIRGNTMATGNAGKAATDDIFNPKKEEVKK